MNNAIINILKKVGAIITEDHLVLVSGRHTHSYINPDKILPHTDVNFILGQMFAKKLKDIPIDVVIGPAYGGIIFSQWVAYHLSLVKKKKILSIFTEKTPERHQIFERGFEKLVESKKVLIVEDITATGSSVKKVIKAVAAAGGKVQMVSVLVNRDPDLVNSETIGAPFCALAEFKIESYDAKECPLCRQKVPINPTIGHGKQFLEHLSKKS
jgi:orotate phosphoribosyltransferase